MTTAGGHGAELDAAAADLAGWDKVIQRLVAIAREELGTDVAYVETRATAAPMPLGLVTVDGEARDERSVDVPLMLPDGRQRGALRFTRTLGRSQPGDPDDRDERFVRVLARLMSEQLGMWESARATWQQRTARIQAVLDAQTLPMVFQPIADLGSGEVVGVEALARFPGPPDQTPDRWFVEAASVGLGTELEILAISEALCELENLPEHAYLSVNVSPRVVTSGKLARALSRAPAERIVLEITEHAEVSDYAELNRSLRRLRAKGIRLAVDDAGSGFASLRHILQMAPDIIKLDISLTHGIDHDSVLRALGYSLASFASAIDAAVVAEGVETEQELNALGFLGVRYGQGYFLRRPGPLPIPDKLEFAPVSRSRTA
ncbi:MAG TPA: EAL domain-containing protein [Egibacteraceae bacterium]|nr:EAL domain-containing protein [Egibacteraceae bacterium]